MKRVRSGGVARRIRLSDPGDDGPSSTSRFLTGCGVGCVALVLLIGALGLVFGAAERVAEWGGEEPGGRGRGGRGAPGTGSGLLWRLSSGRNRGLVGHAGGTAAQRRRR